MADDWQDVDDWEDVPEVQPAPVAPPQADEPGFLESGSQSQAALLGGSRGASFGFRDELAGGVKGMAAGFSRIAADLMKTSGGRALMRQMLGKDLPDSVVDMVTEGSIQQGAKTGLGMKGLPLDPDDALREGYRFGRSESRQDDVEAQAAHPVTYGASEVAGAIAVPGPKLLKPGMPGRMAAIAKTGAAIGGASALGNSTADLTQDGRTLEAVGDTATGAGMGGAMAPLATIGADRLGRWLQQASRDNALKAIGLRAGISNQLTKRGYETADEARDLGQAALDMELIRPFRTASDVAERAQFAKQVQGSRIEGALADADAARLGPFDTERAAWEAATTAAGPQGLSPTAIREATRAQNLVDDVVSLPRVQEPSFANANRMKSDMYSGINYGTDPALKTTLERRAASGLRKSIEEQVAETAGPDVADELRAANKAYGFLSDIEPLARDEATRQPARKAVTSNDMSHILMAGAAGGTVGGVHGGIGAALLTGATKLLGPRVPSTLAVGQQAASPMVRPFVQGALKPALQAPMLGAANEEEEKAINAFLTGG